MATTKEYREFVIEQLSGLNNIVCRPMMGEYLLYCDGILFGGLYDNRLLIKIVDSNRKYALEEVIPYKNAKPMYFVDSVENTDLLEKIVLDTCKDLPVQKKKK